MLDVTVSTQVWAFLCSVLCGLVAGAVYSLFGIVRTVSDNNRIMTFLCDVLYMLIFAVITYIFSIGFTEGFVRAYTLAGELTGFLVFKFTLGALVSKSVKWLLKAFRKIICAIQKNISQFAKKLLKQSHKMLYNKHKKKTSLQTDGKEGLT